MCENIRNNFFRLGVSSVGVVRESGSTESGENHRCSAHKNRKTMCARAGTTFVFELVAATVF